jgi:hypothetical protein
MNNTPAQRAAEKIYNKVLKEPLKIPGGKKQFAEIIEAEYSQMPRGQRVVRCREIR